MVAVLCPSFAKFLRMFTKQIEDVFMDKAVLWIIDSNIEKEENQKNFQKINAMICFIKKTKYSHVKKNISLHFFWVFL